MNDVKISENQFIGAAEYDRLKKMFVEDGYKRLSSIFAGNYGIVRSHNSQDNSFQVTAGTAAGYLKLASGFAIDSANNFLNQEYDKDNIILVPNDGVKYYVLMKYLATPKEKGKINILANGTVAGFDTEFTKVLRGFPNAPSKIKLYGTSNTGIHLVESLTSDTALTLDGSLVAEDDVEYSVYGTFPAHYTPSSGSTEVFEYDGVELILESSAGVSIETAVANNGGDGIAFPIAVVTRNDNSLVINRYTRDKDVFKDRIEAERDGSVHGVLSNPLMGLVAERWTMVEDMSKGWDIKLAWGVAVNTGNWSFNPTTKVMTITSGTYTSGVDTTTLPVYGALTDIIDNVLAGWYVVMDGVQWKLKVLSNSSPASDLLLTIEGEYNEDDFPTTGELFVVPPYDMITIEAVVDGYTQTWKNTFPVNQCLGILKITNPAVSNKAVKFYYTMHTGAGSMQSTSRQLINNSQGANKYYLATDYNYNYGGSLVGLPVQGAVTAGGITLLESKFRDETPFTSVVGGWSYVGDVSTVRIGNIVYMTLTLLKSSDISSLDGLAILEDKYRPEATTIYIDAIVHNAGSLTSRHALAIGSGGTVNIIGTPAANVRYVTISTSWITSVGAATNP